MGSDGFTRHTDAAAESLGRHREWNEDLGIWELDREMKTLQRTLADVQEQIIEGRTVRLPF